MTRTAAGHAGPVYRLHQADHWMAWTEDGVLTKRLVYDMTPPHRRSVLAWLRDHAVQLQADQLDEFKRQRRRGEIDIETYAREVRDLGAQHPAEWLEETALVRRLAELTPRAARPRGLRRFLPRRLR